MIIIVNVEIWSMHNSFSTMFNFNVSKFLCKKLWKPTSLYYIFRHLPCLFNSYSFYSCVPFEITRVGARRLLHRYIVHTYILNDKHYNNIYIMLLFLISPAGFYDRNNNDKPYLYKLYTLCRYIINKCTMCKYNFLNH